MTLLHTRFISGAQLTAGTLGAGSLIGISGLNDMNTRINFANYDFPMNGSLNFTYTAGRITQVVYSGADQVYETNVVYDGGFVGSAVTTGIGSTVTIVLYNNGAGFVSGITKVE